MMEPYRSYSSYIDVLSQFVKQLSAAEPHALAVQDDDPKGHSPGHLKMYFLDGAEHFIGVLGVLKVDAERLPLNGCLPKTPGHYPVPEGLHEYLIRAIAQRLAWNQYSDHGFATEWLTHGLWDTLACRLENSAQMRDYTPAFTEPGFPYLARVTLGGQGYRFQIMGTDGEFLIGRPLRSCHVGVEALPATFPGREWLVEEQEQGLERQLMFMSDCAYLVPDECVDKPSAWFEARALMPMEQACQIFAQVAGLSSYLYQGRIEVAPAVPAASADMTDGASRFWPVATGATVLGVLTALTVIACL